MFRTVLNVYGRQNILRKVVKQNELLVSKKYFSNGKSVDAFARVPTKDGEKKIAPLGWFLLLIPTTTFGLGCWQIKRKSWKENLLKELQEKTQADPVPIPENLEYLQQMEYKPIIVIGEFLHDKEMYMGPRSFVRQDGQVEKSSGVFSQSNESIGYHVITPFKLSGREEIILVNRGWIPRRFLNPETRLNGQITGELVLTGIVRADEKRPQFTPEHKGGIYLYRNLSKMCAESGARPIFIDVRYDCTVPGGPVGGQTRVALRNEHLSYIITWFSLSAATAFMWYRQIYKGRRFR